MVLDRMRNQWPQKKKMELSDYLAVNDEQILVIPQVLSIHKSIRSEK
jgi:hypothetical protein